MGEEKVHWFLPGYTGSEIIFLKGQASTTATTTTTTQSSGENGTNNDSLNIVSNNDDEAVFWRSQHTPNAVPVLEHLRLRNVTHVTLVGVKLSTSLQIWAQHLCDAGLAVSVVQQAVADDNLERQETLLRHLLPIFTTVLDVVEWTEQCNLADCVEGVIEKILDPKGVKWICDTGRGGHGGLYRQHLLRHFEGFEPFPRQRWYVSQSFLGAQKQYYCPLGKKVVHFCDEPQFSRVAMYLSGREHFDEKDKLAILARQANNPQLKFPPTYFIQRKTWQGPAPVLGDGNDDNSVWFLKETNKNGGKAVTIHASMEDCIQASKSEQAYVVQRHISNPLLTVDGYKCHVKFYSMLACDEDGETWTLYTYRDSFLAVAEEPFDQSSTVDTVQITTLRNHRLKENDPEPLERWPVSYYGSCREAVINWMHTIIESGNLKGRAGKRQFEIFSADFMFDRDDVENPFLIEFNGGPVLFDPTLRNQILATRGLKRYQKLFQFYGDEAPVNDHNMIRDALRLALRMNNTSDDVTGTRWEKAATIVGSA